MDMILESKVKQVKIFLISVLRLLIRTPLSYFDAGCSYGTMNYGVAIATTFWHTDMTLESKVNVKHTSNPSLAPSEGL